LGFLEYVQDEWPDLLELSVDHAQIVLVAMAIATVIGVTAGLLCYRSALAAKVALTVTGTFLTIPSFALFGLLVPVLGLGYRPAVVALSMYALLPIVRNTIAGLREVDPAIRESALGMGLGRWQRLRRVEMPLAWPVVMTGIRVSTLIIVGIAAIAAIVNGPGLGLNIFRGLSAIGTDRGLHLALSGTLGVVMLALLFDAAFAVIARLTTSRGIR
jgi:osmoprotectant transport system permease protein